MIILPDDIPIALGNGWAMIHRDCIEVLSHLGDASCDHMITDPPYEDAAHTKQRRVRSKAAGAKGKDLDVVSISFPPIDEATREGVIEQTGRLVKRWILIFCQAEGAHKWAIWGGVHGLKHVRVAAWVKPDGSPQLTGDRPAQGYEAIEIMHPRGRTRWNAGGKRGVYTVNTRWRPENASSYKRGGREGADDHDTTKPITLMLDLVRDFTDEGEIILDPFAGSGTTGVAAIRLGRRFIGIERDEKSFRLAVDRLRAEEVESTLAARRANQLTLFAHKEKPDHDDQRNDDDGQRLRIADGRATTGERSKGRPRVSTQRPRAPFHA